MMFLKYKIMSKKQEKKYPADDLYQHQEDN